MKDKGAVSLHFQGDIVNDHKLSARTLGKTLSHMQNAFDRAFLDLKHGNLWKWARMSSDDFPSADFLAFYPEQGGFIQKLVSDIGKQIVDRIDSALKPAVERVMYRGEELGKTIASEVEDRKIKLSQGILKPKGYQEVELDKKIIRSYADRAINREIDQILSIFRSESSGLSTLSIRTIGSSTSNYQFNKSDSELFHSIVSKRELGSPILYEARIKSLDRGDAGKRLSGKIINLQNNKILILHLLSEDDFLKVHPYLGNNKAMKFIGAPLIEYGTFDPNAGDVYFLHIIE
jgi:hypothetical protein